MAEKRAHVFSSAVKEVLRTWPVLTLAKQHGFGGRETQQKEEWLCESIIQIFTDNDSVYPDELEDFVSEALYNEFDTIVEDGSLKEVCSKMCQYYDMCKGDQIEKVAEEVIKMETKKPVVTAKAVTNDEDDSSSDEGDEDNDEKQATSMDVEMTEDKPTSSSGTQKEYDEDGWEVVRRSKKR